MESLGKRKYGLIALIAVALVLTGFLVINQEAQGNPPSLSITPERGTYQVDKSFAANILLATGEHAIDGVDVIVQYHPSLLRVEDSDPSTPGVQIENSMLMPVSVLNTVDEENGIIRFSQLTEGGATFQTNTPQVLALIHFVPLAAGQATLIFDFLQGQTRDSNIASKGKDILAEVKNAQYTINNGMTR